MKFISIAAVFALFVAMGAVASFDRGFGADGVGYPTTLPAATTAAGNIVGVQGFATSSGSASSSTEEPRVAYTVPTKTDCTAQPLTVDQVMSRLTETSGASYISSSDAAALPPQDANPDASILTYAGSPLSQSRFDELRSRQVEWLACTLWGSPFQRWALESGAMIRSEIQGAYPASVDPARIRTDLENFAAGKPSPNFGASIVPSNGDLPMVIDALDGYQTRQLSDAHAHITVVWVRPDGTDLWSSGSKEQAQVFQNASVSERLLPTDFEFVREASGGPWVLNSIERGPMG